MAKNISLQKTLFRPSGRWAILLIIFLWNSIGIYAMDRNGNIVEKKPAKDKLDRFYSEKKLGCTWDSEHTTFRVFSPGASAVTLVLFEKYTDETGSEHPMQRDKDGAWELVLPGHYIGMAYGYKVAGPSGSAEMFDPTKLVADPYSRAVVTKNDYLHRGKTLIINTSDYDWQGDNFVNHDHEDLIIYECHVRDMTAHPSSGVSAELRGSYKGLIRRGKRGGIDYITSLGVNAVEFLPVQDFANIEIPYNKSVNGVINTWNPYARNHWGYMTSYFFAPESYYASGNTLQPVGYCGADGRQVSEFKDVVKAFHREGIAVIMDVVYNHVSQYDQNCFKLIDKKYYFRLHDDGAFCSYSGCGNDLKTERPMVRRLILDSVKYWMQEYHIDGFRFDLAAMIDWETIDAITQEARKINPNVILIAEPWGGGKYEPAAFSQHDWAAWNDQFRNGVKGQNPDDGQSFIFGRWWQHENMNTIKRYILGDPVEDGGLFVRKAHSINYLESHDDNTFGDFVRMGSGEVDPQKGPFDAEKLAHLSERQLKINKLGALILFTSQGAIMIAEGQEFARSKVIAPTTVPDEHIGFIDHNSYNKDNETNWLNFDHAEMNRDLVDYYRGLVALRKGHPVFRKSARSDIHFIENENPFALGYMINKNSSGDSNDFLVLINAHQNKAAYFKLPPGSWSVLVDGAKAGTVELRRLGKGIVEVPATSGMVIKMVDG